MHDGHVHTMCILPLRFPSSSLARSTSLTVRVTRGKFECNFCSDRRLSLQFPFMKKKSSFNFLDQLRVRTSLALVDGCHHRTLLSVVSLATSPVAIIYGGIDCSRAIPGVQSPDGRMLNTHNSVLMYPDHGAVQNFVALHGLEVPNKGHARDMMACM
jgi:hypothetical protein